MSEYAMAFLGAVEGILKHPRKTDSAASLIRHIRNAYGDIVPLNEWYRCPHGGTVPEPATVQTECD